MIIDENSSRPATMALKLTSDRNTTTLLKAAAFHHLSSKKTKDKNDNTIMLTTADKNRSSKRTTMSNNIDIDDLLGFPSLEWVDDDDTLGNDGGLVRPKLAVEAAQCLQDALTLGRDFDHYYTSNSNGYGDVISLPSHQKHQKQQQQHRPSKRQRTKYASMVRSGPIACTLSSLAQSKQQQLMDIPPKLVFPTLHHHQKTGLLSNPLLPSSLISEHGPSRSLPSLKCTVSPLA